MCAVSVAQTKMEWNDLAATCFIPADNQILTSDNLMHTIPFALCRIHSNQTHQTNIGKSQAVKEKAFVVIWKVGYRRRIK